MPKIAWARQLFNAYHHVKKNDKVYDSNGKRLSRINDQKNSTEIDIDQYKSGVYTIKIMPEAVIYQIIKQ